MGTSTLTCIRCPRGCRMTVTLEGGVVTGVSGNACPRGDRYARDEMAHPVRVVTSSVPVRGSAEARRVSVKTAGDVPKDRVFAVMGALRDVEVRAPVEIGDLVVADVAGTGIDVVATSRA